MALEFDLQRTIHWEMIDMSVLQGIPESGQLFLLGSGLIFLGLIFRAIRKVPANLRARLTSEGHPEPR